MSSTPAILSALPVMLFAFLGLITTMVLFIHLIRRVLRKYSEIDVEAAAATTITEAPLLVSAFKEEEASTAHTSLPSRPSQRFNVGLVAEHTFTSVSQDHNPQPLVKVVRYTPLKQNEAGSWDLVTRVPNVTLSIVQNEKHVVIEQQHDLDCAAQSCVIEEWVPSLPVSPDASVPKLSRSSLPTQKSRLASAIASSSSPSSPSIPRKSRKTARPTVPANVMPSAGIPALWRSSIHAPTTITATTPRSATKAVATRVSTDKSSSTPASTPSRSKSTATVARKPRVNPRKKLDKENRENLKVERESRRKGRAPLAVVNRWV
ncbi:hypothetical protein Moror_3067 [Moniliophthora roreri MCA 2997]|uniref:Uncharacterized protein n=1 Tax=Moniliophthora roreri (strain MCA 2997) TaxID=1381753 RepID=V2YAG0_MONRO|nr:hypothetical protein Moror_3067 [Moniliophthora roreri MCA 2997]